jgi:hypothetical protein
LQWIADFRDGLAGGSTFGGDAPRLKEQDEEQD